MVVVIDPAFEALFASEFRFPGQENELGVPGRGHGQGGNDDDDLYR